MYRVADSGSPLAKQKCSHGLTLQHHLFTHLLLSSKRSSASASLGQCHLLQEAFPGLPSRQDRHPPPHELTSHTLSQCIHHPVSSALPHSQHLPTAQANSQANACAEIWKNKSFRKGWRETGINQKNPANGKELT